MPVKRLACDIILNDVVLQLALGTSHNQLHYNNICNQLLNGGYFMTFYHNLWREKCNNGSFLTVRTDCDSQCMLDWI